jgi:superfamily II DNA helicase RecQ
VDSEVVPGLLQLVHRRLNQKEKAEQDKRKAVRDSDEVTEISPWLEKTEWIRHLEGKDKATMATLVKPAEVAELELQEVEKSLKRLVEKARQTILQKKVSMFLLHRAESYEAGQDSHKVFHVNIGMDTIQRYLHIWSQILVYILRTASTESRLYQFTSTQQDCIGKVMIAAKVFQLYKEDDVEDMQEELDEACLQLCITLLDHQLDGDEYESAILSGLAVISLDSTEKQHRFKDPGQYTPILAGFLKVAKMLTIQYCYEKKQEEVGESSRVLFEELHTRFLVNNTATPVNWVLKVMSYGRGISKRMTAEGCISWNVDTVIYEDIELSMTDFRWLIHKLAEETQEILLHELLFVKNMGELPSYSWAELRDNAAKDEPEWNFIKDGRNRMLGYQRWLLDRILQRKELQSRFVHANGEWRQREVNNWFDKLARFLEKLLILIYMTGGQPARSKELLSVRYCNTEKGGHRSIFVEDGLLSIVTYYHKGYNITGTEKIIHRYLPEEVGDLLLQYIWLVLPLRQQLQKLVYNDKEIASAFLWSVDRGKKWTGDRVREVIKRESDRLIGIQLNKKSYRHIAIAISDRFMKRGKFDKNKENKNEDELQDEAIAKQSAHTPETAGSAYARFLQEAPSHIQTMRYRFRTVSLEWHNVLHFNKKLQQESRLDVSGGLGIKRGRVEEHERSPGPRIRRWQALRHTDLQAALQQLMGRDTEFRGKQQAALRAIMDGKSPIILVMPTGGGKSLMFMLPASVKDAGTTVVVTPLIALKQDMQKRCRELGLECIVWGSGRRMHDSCIVLVTPESAVSQGFMNYMRKLQSMDRLDRIVIDECHILLNTRLDFRRKLQKLRKVVEFAVQLVLLTATLPPSKKSELLSMISIEAPIMFRDKTTRHNIAYSVLQCEAKEIDEVVMKIVSRVGDGRVIVYGGRVEYCKKLAEMLSCEAYFAEAEKKTEALQAWIEGRTRVIVGTNALGLGIDVPNVRLVVHVGGMFDLLNYGQESGRAGRDGRRSEAIAVIGEGPGKYKDTEERLMWEYLLSEGCRRVKLDQYLDGNLETQGCVEGQEACDNCERSREVSDEDMAMVEAADMAEYEEQQDKMRRQQVAYRQKRMTRAEELQGLQEVLDGLVGRCVWCRYHGEEEEHEFRECTAGREVWEVYCKARREIKYARYAACWGCGCPQWVCKAYMAGGDRQCRYRDIVLAGAVVAMQEEIERVEEVAGREFSSGVEVVQWYGGMGGIHGKQCSNAAVVFNIVFN